MKLRLCLVLALSALFVPTVLRAADEKDDEQGFVALFDGKSLAGWTGGEDSYKIEDGRNTTTSSSASSSSSSRAPTTALACGRPWGATPRT